MKRIFSLMLLCAAVIFAGCSKDNPDPDPTPIPVASVTLDKASLSLEIAKTATLVATITPKDAAVTAVVWSSDKPAVATVDDKGVVTAVAEGAATITVKTEDGGKTATCTVTVVKAGIAVTEVKLNKAEISIAKGGTETLTMTVLPENATDKTVTWTSSDETVATVADGIVTAMKGGTVTITVTSVADNTKKVTCKVEVRTVDYIEVNDIKVAIGNLVADGPNGAKIGLSTDAGLFFQFGSLIGWSPTETASIAVSPAGYIGNTDWNSKWTGDPTKENVATSTGDPCKYYLKGTWRLPTKDELKALFGNSDYPNAGPWTWIGSPASITHTSGLTIQASNSIRDGKLHDGDQPFGYFWSSSSDFTYKEMGYMLSFSRKYMGPNVLTSMDTGFPVRCIQD